MTENKRFTIADCGCYYDNGKYLNTFETGEMLNNLYEENVKLKSDIVAIEKRADKVYDENEQLKQQIKDMEIRFKRINSIK